MTGNAYAANVSSEVWRGSQRDPSNISKCAGLKLALKYRSPHQFAVATTARLATIASDNQKWSLSRQAVASVIR
jgi:hypothetical protein